MLVQIDYELNFETPFHLGTGIRQGLIDRTVIRNKAGYLYVPASTFKGVIRECCENLLRFYTTGEANVASPHNTYAALTEFGQKPNLISRIFGSSLYAGTIRFNDAKLKPEFQKEAYKNMQTSILTQVRINRLTRTSVDEALYTSEFGMRDLIFEGSIKGHLDCTAVPLLSLATAGDSASAEEACTPSYSLLLLLAGLLLIERLGGNRSTGKGQCTCNIRNLLIDGQQCSEEQWQFWIENLDVLSDYLDGKKGA